MSFGATLVPSNALMETSLNTLLLDGAAFLKLSEIDSPRLEAELLLADVLSCQRIALYSDLSKPISAQAEILFWSHLERRCLNEPLQYITGSVSFCGLELKVGPGVFIPRPETELIVEAAEKISSPVKRILDLCTGSAALAIALAKSFPAAQVIASDYSEAALAVAGENVASHNCSSQISLLRADKLEAFFATCTDDRAFDLIACNPPYIAESDRESLPANVRDYEPDIALFAPDEGRAFYDHILSEAPAILKQDGTILLELGMGQAEWLRQQVEKTDQLSVTFISDWAGIKRIAQISKKQVSNG